MTLQLPTDIEARIRQKVERGDFPDAAEVVREAMRLLDAQERQLEELRVKLQASASLTGEKAFHSPPSWCDR